MNLAISRVTTKVFSVPKSQYLFSRGSGQLGKDPVVPFSGELGINVCAAPDVTAAARRPAASRGLPDGMRALAQHAPGLQDACRHG